MSQASHGIHWSKQSVHAAQNGQEPPTNWEGCLAEAIHYLEGQISELHHKRGDYREVQDLLNESKKPFNEEILAEEFPKNFKMSPIKKYDK